MESAKFSFLSGFSDDGAFFFIKNTEERLIISNILSSESFEIDYQSHIKSLISSIKISNLFVDSKLFLLSLGFLDGTLLVLDLLSRNKIFLNKPINQTIADIQYSYSSESLFVITYNQNLFQYDLRTHQLIMSYSFEAKLPVKNLTFAILKNQRNLLFACEKKSFVFDYVSKEILQKFQTHSKPITSLFSLQKSQLFLTYTDEAFISIFKINKKVPLLQLKGNANSFLKDLTVSKIKKNHYLISAQYTELIKFWVIELTMKFTQPKILDSYTVKAQKNENISNSFMKNSQELIFCIGHHSDLKFCVLHDIIEKETEEKSCGINKLALEEEIRKLDWIGTGLVRKETKNKTKTQSHQINEERTHVSGDLDMLHHGLLSKKPKSFSQNQEKFVEKNNKNIVESLSVHLTQSLISNDQEMIDFCLSNTDENLIQNTIENLKNTYLSLFLDVLIAKIISYPNRSKNLIRWLKYLLRSNTSYFIGCVDLKQKFANLQTILLNKTRNLPKLIDLKNKILCINDKNSENTDFGLRKKVNTGLDSRKHRPLLIIEEGELEKFEEIKLGMEEEEKGKKNEFLEISMSENEENQTEKEFNKAIKIKQNELEEVNEEFIEI